MAGVNTVINPWILMNRENFLISYQLFKKASAEKVICNKFVSRPVRYAIYNNKEFAPKYSYSIANISPILFLKI
jgi:hypothetical protein